MELLIVRHAEVQKAGLVSTDDGPLTEAGIRQAVLTATWLGYNFRLDGFVGFTGPFQGCLQTASMISSQTGVGIEVVPGLRDFKFHETKGGFHVENRSIRFANLSWDAKALEAPENVYPDEPIEEFLVRCRDFLYVLAEKKYDKVILVTHATPAFVLAELALGKTIDQVNARCTEVVKLMESPKAVAGLLNVGKHPMLGAVANCGMTWIDGNEQHWFSKVVYE